MEASALEASAPFGTPLLHDALDMAGHTGEFKWRYAGELICDRVDDRALLALAEQLEVNPPVETQEREATGSKGTYAAKFAPKGVGYEATGEFTNSVERARTYRSASIEVRLQRVLGGLLQQRRLFDLTESLTTAYSLSVTPKETLAGHATRTSIPSAAEMLKKNWDYEFAVRFTLAAHTVGLGREWVVVEGVWQRENEPLRLTLRQVMVSPKLIQWSEEKPIEAVFGDRLDGEGLVLTAQGRRRLQEEMVATTVFGSAHLATTEFDSLTIDPIAVFDRKGGDPNFSWGSSRTYQDTIEDSSDGPRSRVRAVAHRLRSKVANPSRQ